MTLTSGWLHKKGPLGSFGERRRWFAVDAARRELAYYKAPEHHAGEGAEKRRQGCIRLAEVTSIDNSQVGKHAIFDLVTPHRVYELRASSAEEARDWVETLRPLVGGPIAGAARSARAGASQPERSCMTEPLIKQDGLVSDSYLPCVPWCVETIWLDESQHDAQLHITADLGPMPAGGFKTINVMLSDGTKMVLDSSEFDLLDGEFHEVAVAGDKVMLAQLSKLAAGSGATDAAAKPTRALLPAEIVVMCATSAAIGAGLSRVLQQQGTDTGAVGTVGGMALIAVLLLAAAVAAVAAAWCRRMGPGSDRGAGDLVLAAGSEEEARGGFSGYRLLLRAALKTPSGLREANGEDAQEPQTAAERSGRLSHPERKTSGSVTKLLAPILSGESGPAESTTVVAAGTPVLSERDESATVFTGKWKLNLKRSDDPSEMLKEMGVPMLARAAVARYARTLMIEQDGLEWTETMVTPVITKTVSMALDGTPHVEMSPVDKNTLTMVTHYEDKGRCVVTRSKSSDGIRSQVVRRYLIEGGKTYQTINTLKIGGKEITITNYFDRVE